MDLINDDSDGEQESNVWEQAHSGRNGYIFLIDARKPMFQCPDKSYFLQSFESCLAAMLQIAREQRYDLVSFVIFGTKKIEGKFAPANVVLLQSLQTPTVSYISKIKEMIDGKFSDVQNYGQVQDISLAKVLNYCKGLLHYCRTKLYNRSIVLFTTDDDPCKNDVSAHAARTRAKEIRDHQIDLDVVGLGNFDSSKFFKELILTSKGELLKDWIGTDPIKKIDDLQREIGCISRKYNRHFGTFYLGEEAKLKILFYKLYHEPQKLMWTYKDKVTTSDEPTEEQRPLEEDVTNFKQEEGDIFDRDTQEVSTTVNANVESHSNKFTFTEDVSKASGNNKHDKHPLIGGRYIPMSKTELKWFEAKVSKGLTLIGFRPIPTIPAHLIVGESCFIVPDTRDKASAELFSLLHESCLQKNVAALCWYALTKSASPSPVLLFPVEASEYANGKMHSAGFHATKIPFSDMINDCIEGSGFPEIEASENQKEAADAIIRKTTTNWSPDSYGDVEYIKRIAMIEAIAMEYEDSPTVIDETDIDLDDVAEHLGELNEKFIDCSHLPPESLGKRIAIKKSSQEPSSKEAKQSDPASLISMIKAGKAEELTVAQLRELLRGEGVKSLSAMNKPRLISVANNRFKSDS